uniref:Uncharacterized protein n=1 Tax=Kalanchoe fedtschenkoi TaxID=63787 RepID=A0A7N0RGM8_KALFE
MAYRARLLQSCRTPVRSLLTQSPSPISASRITAVAKNEPSLGVRTLRGLALSVLQTSRPALTRCYSAGRRLSARSIIGFSMAYGFINCWPGVTFAMAGDEQSIERSYTNASSHSDSAIDKNQLALWNFVKKVWIPSLLLVNVVLTSWNRPIEFVVKIILALLSTKPNPFSIYICVEQLCNQYKLQHPWSYSSKALLHR